MSGYLGGSSLHKNNFLFSKSSAMIGGLGPVSRARVMDLWSDDPEKQPSAPQRVPCCKVVDTHHRRESLQTSNNSIQFEIFEF